VTCDLPFAAPPGWSCEAVAVCEQLEGDGTRLIVCGGEARARGPAGRADPLSELTPEEIERVNAAGYISTGFGYVGTAIGGLVGGHFGGIGGAAAVSQSARTVDPSRW
jgi:hypothetical protein